jgi:hypothetical protein
MTEKTPAQIAIDAALAAIQAAAAQASEKAALRAQEEAAKQAAIAEAKAAKKAERAKAKQDKKDAVQARKDARSAQSAAKKAAKEAAKATKAVNTQPVQNDVRRPLPGSACGNAWALMDELSRTLGAPVAIGDLMAVAAELKMNDNTVRSSYSQWRKFNGVTGRVPSQMDLAKRKIAAEAAAAAAATQAQ